jgi:hypothetical protein
MKIAMCLQGLSYGKSDVAARGHQKIIEGNFQACIDESLTKLFSDHEVDFFTHTWGFESSSIISQYLKPIKSLYEAPIRFAPEGDYTHSVKSRWYSTYKSVDLLSQHINETSVKYDFIFLSRYDVKYFNDFDLSNLSKNKFYASNWVTDNPAKDGLLDYWFLCNQNDAIAFSQLYYDIDELLQKDPYPSSHWLAMRRLQQLGIDKRLCFIKNEKIDFNLTRRALGWTAS